MIISCCNWTFKSCFSINAVLIFEKKNNNKESHEVYFSGKGAMKLILKINNRTVKYMTRHSLRVTI